MQEQMHQAQQQPDNNSFHPPGQQAHKAPKQTQDEGDYIDFEEIK
jgi:hypothetical protein